MDIAELARQADIHRITPLTPSMLSALERLISFAGDSGTKQRCIKIVEDMAEQCGSRPMKSILLKTAEEIRTNA